jgi:hypothetical protein
MVSSRPFLLHRRSARRGLYPARERGRFPGPHWWWPLVFVGTALMFWSPTVVGHGRRCHVGGGFAFFGNYILWSTVYLPDRHAG